MSIFEKSRGLFVSKEIFYILYLYNGENEATEIQKENTQRRYDT